MKLGQTETGQVWVVVLNYNGLEDTLRCLRSLTPVQNERVRIVLVDNASKEDPTAAVAGEFPWCAILRREENGGWAGGNNTGIKHARERGADFVILLNNDTIVSPNIVERLCAAADAHPEFGVLGPVINVLERPDEVMTDGVLFNDGAEPGFFLRLPVPLQTEDPPRVVEVDIVNGCCMMIARRVFDKIGLIDEEFFIVHEESDFCLRAKKAGFRCGVIAESHVWHKQSSTFARTGKRWQRYYDSRNLKRLISKHDKTHPTGRGRWSSRKEYLRQVYYSYCLEREAGEQDAADAVIEGMLDGCFGFWGVYRMRKRRLLPIVRWLFDLRHKRHLNRQRTLPSANA